jgi:hypothetical protein
MYGLLIRQAYVFRQGTGRVEREERRRACRREVSAAQVLYLFHESPGVVLGDGALEGLHLVQSHLADLSDLLLHLHRIASHHITSHHITSHHITSHRIASHRIASHHITSHHITSHHITSHHMMQRHIASHK